MEQTEATNPSGATATQDPEGAGPAEQPQTEQQPGFRTRGRARRRARFLRKARELAYRDLGGLVYNLHRFGQRNDALVLAKLATLAHIDDELRAIEAAIGERRRVTVLREAGITACPRCAAIHSSEDRFCPNCGLPMSRHADLPVAGAPAAESFPAGAAPPPTGTFTGTHVPAAAAGPEAGQAVTPAAPSDQPPAAGRPSMTSPSGTAQPPTPSPSGTAQPPTPSPPGTGAPAADPVPAGANAQPATATHATVASSGRSPLPPQRTAGADTQRSAPPDEQTEIIRPPARDS